MRWLLIAQSSLERVRLRVRRKPQVLFDELTDLLNERVETCAFFVDNGRTAHERHECSVAILNADSRRTLSAFDDDLDLAILLFLRLENTAQRSNPVDLFGSRFVDRGVVLSG